jgi:hypothetical protein
LAAPPQPPIFIPTVLTAGVPMFGTALTVVGSRSGPAIRLRYIGYLPWTRGCALGGCYGYYGVYGGCYWKEVPVADGRGGWVRGVEKICN